jgi:hypothetical protein
VVLRSVFRSVAAGPGGEWSLTAFFLIGSVCINVPFICRARCHGALEDPTLAWKLLAVASRFEPISLLGSVASVIVAEQRVISVA